MMIVDHRSMLARAIEFAVIRRFSLTDVSTQADSTSMTSDEGHD